MSMRNYYLYEIEASEKPIFETGTWEDIDNLTKYSENSSENEIVAYGEIESNKYLALYEKNRFL